MDRWIDHVAAELGVEADVPVDELLDAARDVAHSVERRATPVTTFLIGLAVQKHPRADAAELCRRVAALARDWENGSAR